MKVPIITQLLGGKNAEAGVADSDRRGSTLASSFADMIRTALGRRHDAEGARADAAQAFESENKTALAAGDGAAFASTSLLLPGANGSPSVPGEPEIDADQEASPSAGSHSTVEFAVDEQSLQADAARPVAQSNDIAPNDIAPDDIAPGDIAPGDVDGAAIHGNAGGDGRLGPLLDADFDGSLLSDVPQSDLPLSDLPLSDVPVDAEPGKLSRPAAPTADDQSPTEASSSTATELRPDHGRAHAPASDDDAPQANSAAKGADDSEISTTASSSRSVADIDAPPVEAKQHQAPSHLSSSETSAQVTGDVTGKASSAQAGQSVETSASIGTGESSNTTTETRAATAGHTGAVGSPDTVASQTIAAGDVAPTTRFGQSAAPDITVLTASAADTIASELADIIEAQGKPVLEAAEAADNAGRASASSPSEIVKPDGATAKRPFVVIDARTAPPEPTENLQASGDELAADVQFEELSGDVTSHDTKVTGRSAAPEFAAVPSDVEQPEARSTDKASQASTVAASVREGDGSSAGNDDTSDRDSDHRPEPVATAPAEAAEFDVEEAGSQLETAVEAPKESPDEAVSLSEDPLQTTAHRTADAAATTARAGQTAPAARSSMQAAWLRAMMEQAPGAVTTAAGWSSLTVSLDDSDGTMTVEARRDERHVAVQVSFSDPNLRSIAAQNMERLEAALRAQYDTAVDLSLTSDGQSGDNRETSDGGPARRHNAPQEATSAARTTRSVPLGATREWVG